MEYEFSLILENVSEIYQLQAMNNVLHLLSLNIPFPLKIEKKTCHTFILYNIKKWIISLYATGHDYKKKTFLLKHTWNA